MHKKHRVYMEERFRTPLEQERGLGLWVDRIGKRQNDPGHPDHYRILGQYAAVAITAGSGTLEMAASEAHPVKQGDVILLSPKAATRYYPTIHWSTLWIVWNGHEAAVLEKLGGFRSRGPIIKDGAASVSLAWQRLAPLMERQDFDAVLGRKTAVLDLIRELSLVDQLGQTEENSSLLASAVRMLFDAGGKPMPIDSVAKRLHMSPTHFRRVFKRLTGSPPKAYQMAQRMTRAKELLAKRFTIKAVSDELGFTDVFHFMRVFRKMTGQTAGQFTSVFSQPDIGTS